MITLALAAALATPSFADEVRVGVFVGNDEGAPGEIELLFAVADAEKMRDLFVDYGGVRPQDASLLEDGTRRQVEGALQQARSRIEAAKAAGHHTSLVFYYSGHADEAGLHLGATKIAHDELRTWLDDSGADVRIAMLDACHSGSAIRAKGGSRGPDLDWAVQVQETRGTAILTSSAASELSQESAEVGGGFFTHYLHTALLGAADYNRDGEVSLDEAKSYVHGETVFGTRDAPGAQTPGYDTDLVGTGHLTLTTLESATAHLAFQGTLDGVYAIWDDQRKRYVAEVAGDQALQVAVRPGTYYVHKRMPGWVDEARKTVRRGETLAVYPEDFVSVAYDDTAARGELKRQVRRASMPDLSLRMAFGGRAWGDVYASQYVPTHGLIGIEARFLKTGRTWFAFDLLNGAGAGTLDFEEIGEKRVNVGSTSLGAAVGYVTRPALFRGAIGGKAELIGVRRTFPDGSLGPQSSVGVAVGPTMSLGLYRGRFSLDLAASLLIMPTSWDGLDRRPIYFEPVLAVGYRF